MAKDLSKKKIEDLQKELAGTRKKLQEFRFSVTGSGAKNSMEARDLKKTIARILTEMRARQTK
jgi:ribosomal protein L29